MQVRVKATVRAMKKYAVLTTVNPNWSLKTGVTTVRSTPLS